MKLRIISDLHIDINRDYPLDLKKAGYDDAFTLIAGDICGNVDKTIEWVEDNVKQGAFISGNHDGYDNKKIPIEDVKSKLHQYFPLDCNVTYFDNDVGVISKDLGNNLLLVADVMYTDYRLRDAYWNPKGDPERNKFNARPKMSGSYMNDFVYTFTRKETYRKGPKDDEIHPDEVGLWRLTPECYEDHFRKAFRAIDKIVKENPTKDIILMTHHCLSKLCISEEFSKDSLNASYVSNKSNWIRTHPNIKLVVSGHVHHRAHFHVGKALYVMNPLGYCRETLTQWCPESQEYIPWTPNCIVDTDTWNVSYEFWDSSKWIKTQKAEREEFLKYASMFGY